MSPLRVLVAGGGVAAVEGVLALRALAGERVEVELLAPGDDFVHRPASVLTPFAGTAAPRLPLDRLGVTRHEGALAALDAERQVARTTGGRELPYDRLIVATGARTVEGVPGATTFRGPHSAGAVEGALRHARERVLFAVPGTATWTLPVYELALLAAHELEGPELMIVTPEREPLELFGPLAAEAVGRVLDRAGVDFEGETVPEEVLDDSLLAHGGRLLAGDAVIALPRLVSPGIEGLPADTDGFVPIDEHARVVGASGVYAAGDITAGPVKQGGLAAQQADAAAEAIAAEAGAPVEPRPYRPVLRGLLLTGGDPLYLRSELVAGGPQSRLLSGAPSLASRSELWWPPAKVAGRHLAGFLAGEAAQMTDWVPEPTSADERAAAYQLLTMLADADADAGDYRSAVEALDSAAALCGGKLPADAEQHRAEWLAAVR
ncbi:MAG TPA: FAD/NAD(P)-binding oxidoreductase [Solirubrobacteraceae bacterium]